jgi:hypothetical protein
MDSACICLELLNTPAFQLEFMPSMEQTREIFRSIIARELGLR